MIEEEPVRYGVPIVRSVIDGSQVPGPILVGEAAARAYKEGLATMRRPTHKLVGIVWLKKAKPPPWPPYVDLVAETVEQQERYSGSLFSVLTTRRR